MLAIEHAQHGILLLDQLAHVFIRSLCDLFDSDSIGWTLYISWQDLLCPAASPTMLEKYLLFLVTD